jgi:hypothetical protein
VNADSSWTGFFLLGHIVFAVSGNITPSTERILVDAISEELSSKDMRKMSWTSLPGYGQMSIEKVLCVVFGPVYKKGLATAVWSNRSVKLSATNDMSCRETAVVTFISIFRFDMNHSS